MVIYELRGTIYDLRKNGSRPGCGYKKSPGLTGAGEN